MKFILNDKVYDVLKFICLTVLPAIELLWIGLAKIWGFPYGVEIAGTIALIDTFLGSLLGISSHNYNKLNGDN